MSLEWDSYSNPLALAIALGIRLRVIGIQLLFVFRELQDLALVGLDKIELSVNRVILSLIFSLPCSNSFSPPASGLAISVKRFVQKSVDVAISCTVLMKNFSQREKRRTGCIVEDAFEVKKEIPV